MRKYLVSMCLFFIVFSNVNAEQGKLVDYPQEYRQWMHVKSMVIQEGHALENPFLGIHHIYANELALQGLRTGEYRNGATFVFDLLATHHNDHALTEGNRKLIGVMKKDRNKFPKTGGWGFEGFAGNSKDERLTTDGGKSCYGCHTQRVEQDFVFTTLRD